MKKNQLYLHRKTLEVCEDSSDVCSLKDGNQAIFSVFRAAMDCVISTCAFAVHDCCHELSVARVPSFSTTAQGCLYLAGRVSQVGRLEEICCCPVSVLFLHYHPVASPSSVFSSMIYHPLSSAFQ